MNPDVVSPEREGRDEKFLARCGSWSRAAAALIFLVGFLTLLGWLFDLKFLLRTSPNMVVMKANAAFSFVLSGISLWLVGMGGGSRSARAVAGACALVPAILGALTLSEHAVGWDLGIDQILAREAPGAVKTASPGRMAPNAALNFALLGTSLLLVALRRAELVASGLAVAGGLIGILAVMGYAYASTALIGFASYTHIALQTALAFVALSTGILLATKDRGLTGFLSRGGSGSLMARRLLPAVVLVPVLFGWIRHQGMHLGYFEDEFGVALMVVSGMFALAAVVWYNAVRLNRSDRDRKTAERDSRGKARELARTSALLERIFSNIQFMVVFLDPHFRFVRVNQAYADACGYPPEFFVGKNHFDLYPHEENEAIFRRVVETGETFTVFAKPFEFPDHPERGVTYWDWSLHPVRGEDAAMAGLIFTLVDVTERVRTQSRLRENEQTALRQEKMAVLGQLAAGIAHEVRNPLSGLNIYLASADAIRGETELPDPAAREMLKRALDSARAASRRIEEVIRRVMDFARPGRPALARIRVNDAVREALDLVAATLRKNGIRVEAVLSEDIPSCRGDLRLVEQVLLNFITNAAQALEGRAGERRIEVSSAVEGADIVVSVADSGAGVPEALRERIFDPFFTTRLDGTGLGLAISRRIVSDHGGAIEVATSRFGGAEFRVRLPAAADPGSAT